MHTKGLFIISILLLVGMTACRDGSSNADSAASSLPELSQSVTSKDGVTVKYPAGWFDPLAEHGVFLYNEGLSLLRTGPGGLFFQINTQPSTSGRTPADLFDSSFNPVAKEMGITLSEKKILIVGSVEAIKATGKSDVVGLYAALLPVSEGFVTVVAYAHSGELDRQTPLIEAILSTITYTKVRS